jgi:type VI protein secretion system component Hcp
LIPRPLAAQPAGRLRLFRSGHTFAEPPSQWVSYDGRSEQEASVPIFMQMGLPGESNRLKGPVEQPPHVDWFEVSSVQFGISRHAVYSSVSSSAGRRDRVEPVFRELIITMPDTGPLFFKASIDGEPFKTVIIDFERNGQPYLVLKLTNVLVFSYSLGNGGGQPVASVTLSFIDIEQHYSAASARLGSGATANPVGELLPLAVLRHLVNTFMAP